MGWNTGYTIYEETVIAVYNTGMLSPELLAAIILPYKDTDIDHGGCHDLLTKDGLSADEVVLKLLRPDFWAKYTAHNLNLTPDDEDYKYHPDFHDHWKAVMGSY